MHICSRVNDNITGWANLERPHVANCVTSGLAENDRYSLHQIHRNAGNNLDVGCCALVYVAPSGLGPRKGVTLWVCGLDQNLNDAVSNAGIS